MNQLMRNPLPERHREQGVNSANYMTSWHGTTQPAHVGTEAFAEMMLVEAETVLKSHSKNGHYCGIRPTRLPNRKLAWPIAEIEKLFSTLGYTTSSEVAA